MGRLDEEMYRYLSMKEHFADLINAGCFGGREVLMVDDLEELTGRTQEINGKNALHSLQRDIRMRLRNGTHMALFAVENQTKIDWEMPLRIMRYDVSEYKKQAEEIHRRKRRKREEAGLKQSRWLEKMDEPDKLQPIFTVCFYHGDGAWDGPKTLKDIVDFGEGHEEWEKQFCDYSIKVINAEDETVARNCRTQLRQFLNVMAVRKNASRLDHLLQSNEYADINAETARIISVAANLPNFLENMEDYKNQESEGYNMCQAMEEIKKECMESGRSEGRAEGSEETLLQDLSNLMDTLQLNMEQAMDALKIAQEKRSRLKGLLKR